MILTARFDDWPVVYAINKLFKMNISSASCTCRLFFFLNIISILEKESARRNWKFN